MIIIIYFIILTGVSGMATSFAAILGFADNVCPAVEPQIGVSITKAINRNFVRSYQIGLPPTLALCFQYQDFRKTLSAIASLDGSVQGNMSYRINEAWEYSLNAMCSPAPDSLATRHSLTGSFRQWNCGFTTDLHSLIAGSGVWTLPPILVPGQHSIGGSISLHKPSMQEDSIGDYKMFHGAIGHSWGIGDYYGANTYSSTDNSITVSAIGQSNSRSFNSGFTIKYPLNDDGHVVMKVGGTYIFQRPAALSVGLTSNFKVTATLAGLVPPEYSTWIAGQVQGQLGASYCPTTGVAFNLGFEINEM